MTARRLAFVCVVVFLATVVQAAYADDSFTLWQLPNQTRTQMMSYVIQTHNGKVVVFDGGTAGDAVFLADFLRGLGGRVDVWFMTHAHDDHYGALNQILVKRLPLRIEAIYGSLPDAEWMRQYGDAAEVSSFNVFTQTLKRAERCVEELSAGQVLEVDGVVFEVLGVKNPEIVRNAVNNSSIVVRAADKTKSVLFLGDLGMEGGEKLLKSPQAARLPSDYVQMAHHGQHGVSEAFYRCVQPSYCLWPTPQWLWDNDSGGGKNSGRWLTLEVRAWMEKMPIKRHFVMCEGLCRIE